MRLPLLLILASLAVAATQEEQNRLWEEAMRKSAAAPKASATAPQAKQEAAQGPSIADLSAEADKAALAYARAVAAKLKAIIEAHPRPVVPEISDGMTVSASREAYAVKELAQIWDEVNAGRDMIMRDINGASPRRAAAEAASAEYRLERQIARIADAK